MTIAHELLEKIYPAHSRLPGNKPSPKSADKLLNDFSTHLKWLIARHVKKINDENYYVSSCYGKARLLKNDHERNAYCKSHLVIADRCLDELLEEMKRGKDKIDYKTAKAFKEIIKDYIFDVRPLAEYLERKKDPNYVFLKGDKSYGVNTWEIFRISRQLAIQSAYRSTPLHFDHKSSQITAVFALRQALEEKFFRLIAVDFYDAVGGTPKLKHFYQYDFIIKNPSYFDFKAVDFALLRKIYEWCNEVVHNVYQPLAWQTFYAQKICRGLFEAVRVPKGSRWNINNAVEISNLKGMQDEYVNHFWKTYDHGVWCEARDKPEALVI